MLFWTSTSHIGDGRDQSVEIFFSIANYKEVQGYFYDLSSIFSEKNLTFYRVFFFSGRDEDTN